MKTYPFDFYTQYRQFYIYDETSPFATDSATFWTTEASESRMAIEDGILGIGTECFGPVKGELVTLEKENTNYKINKYDHIVESGLKIISGYIQISPCASTEVIVKLKVKPCSYRLRVYSSNLDSVHGEKGNDFYRIEIWEDSNLERKLIKKYEK